VSDTPIRKRTNWGQEIRRLREEQHLSQRRLAKLACVDRASLRRFEDGDSRGNIELIEALAEVLGYELDLIYCGYSGGLLPPDQPDQLPGE
jgi:transcriptional regulator with XRE-family HTH domain